MHKGTYADDCIATRVMQHRCYIVATNDQALRRRIRKIPGVPIMFVGRGKYKVERLPIRGTNHQKAWEATLSCTHFHGINRIKITE
jgi:Fcf1